MKFWWILFAFFTGVACTQQKSNDKTKNEKQDHVTCFPVFTSFDSARISRMDAFFIRHLKSGDFNGNVLLYCNGKMFRGCYGYSNYVKKTPLNDSSVFQLASVSKPITAIAIMQLVEQGKLHLTDTISNIIDSFPYSKITLEMLLSHRSGLSNYMYITDSIWVNQNIPMCNADIIDSFIVRSPLPYYPPGKKFNYSNTNYFLLGAIVEKVTGREFGSWVQEHIFDSIGMKHTLVYSDMKMHSIDNLALGSENRRWHLPDYYLNGITGDKGVYSTTMDLLKLHFALQSGTILSYTSVQEMYSPRSEFDRKGRSYGLGWRIMKESERYPRVVYHNGWWRGYRAYFIRIPEEDIAIIVLSNLASGRFLNKYELIDLVRDSEQNR